MNHTHTHAKNVVVTETVKAISRLCMDAKINKMQTAQALTHSSMQILIGIRQAVSKWK